MNTPTPKHPPNAPDPLAVALAKLDPTPHGFEWNALMFAAGRESKARALLFWRVTACAAAVAAAGFAVAFFAQWGAPVPVERVVYVERIPPAVPAPDPVPPAPLPLPAPEVRPESPAPASPGWSFDPPPAQGSAARWLNFRNEVLTVGLGVLPDNGPRVSGPSNEK